MSASKDKCNSALENLFAKSSKCNLDEQDIYVVLKVSTGT